MARNLISIIGHIIFGAVLAWTYLKLARPHFAWGDGDGDSEASIGDTP